jgi:quinolinate synthase
MSIPFNIPSKKSTTELLSEIQRLKKKHNAVILAHYYQDGAIQDLADFVGDSLDLSRKAAATDADVIVFCGVRFMAEVAKILSPTKKVILPDMEAGCSLEDSCPPEDFRKFREKYPDHICLTYINCSAEIKTMSDIIVTSSNAEHILSQIPKDQKIMMAPDENLGKYLATKTGRDMILWPGSCIVHERFSEKELIKLKTEMPNVPVAAHPECPPFLLQHAQHVGSTSSILKYVLDHPSDTFIIATEPGIIHQMQKDAPHKTFIGAPGQDGKCSCNQCPYMALNTVQKLYESMLNLGPEIQIEEETRLKALKPLQKMFDMSPTMASNRPQDRKKQEKAITA